MKRMLLALALVSFVSGWQFSERHYWTGAIMAGAAVGIIVILFVVIEVVQINDVVEEHAKRPNPL